MALSITVLGRKIVRYRIFQELKRSPFLNGKKIQGFLWWESMGTRIKSQERYWQLTAALVEAPVRAEPWIQEGIQVIMTGLLLRNKRTTLYRNTFYIYLKGNWKGHVFVMYIFYLCPQAPMYIIAISLKTILYVKLNLLHLSKAMKIKQRN